MTALPSPALPRRLAALLYDTFLLLPMIMVVVAVATAVQVLVTGNPGAQDYSVRVSPWLVQALSLVTVVAFYDFFWCRTGQSLGMQAWRIRLRSDTGETVTRAQALRRAACACISLAAFGLGFLWCLVDREGRYWHDMASQTRLELLPKPNAKE